MKENYNPKGIGEKSEAQILAALLKADKVVLLPFGDNQRYDMVVHEAGEFFRIQCKTARKRDGYIEFATCSTNWNSGKSFTYEGEIDFFAAYVREDDKVYFIPISETSKRSCRLRLEPAKNNQKKRTRDACDYLFTIDKDLKKYCARS